MAFDLTARLDERRARQRFRQPTLMDGPCGRTAMVDGREHLNFCANDYLGLAGEIIRRNNERNKAGKAVEIV